MTQITGYECDVCKKFSTNRDRWMKLQPYADQDNKGFDICSNTCLVKLARIRKTEMGY